MQPNIYVSWFTSELRVRFAPWNRFKPSSKIIYWPVEGGTSFVDLLCVFYCLLFDICLWVRLFICALWSPAGKGLTSWLSLVVSNCEFVTFPLVSRVRCGTWLYRFLIFAPLLNLIDWWILSIHIRRQPFLWFTIVHLVRIWKTFTLHRVVIQQSVLSCIWDQKTSSIINTYISNCPIN